MADPDPVYTCDCKPDAKGADLQRCSCVTTTSYPAQACDCERDPQSGQYRCSCAPSGGGANDLSKRLLETMERNEELLHMVQELNSRRS